MGTAIAKVKKEDIAERANDAEGVVLYDATRPQRIPLMVEHDGEMFQLAFTLDAQTDQSLIEYDRLCDRRLFQASKQETGERNAVASTDETFGAAVWLFNDRALSAEGFDVDDLPENWKDSIADADKAAVIDDAYLAAQIVSAPIAKPGKKLPLGYRQQATMATVHVRALFEGHELELAHQLKAPTADQLSRYKSIQKERILVQGTHLHSGETRIPPKFRKYGELYDQIKEHVTGYANDKVPLHHKVLVVIDHFSKQIEATTKN